MLNFLPSARYSWETTFYPRFSQFLKSVDATVMFVFMKVRGTAQGT